MKTTVKIRRSWGLTNPATRKIESKKIYNRKKSRKKFDGD